MRTPKPPNPPFPPHLLAELIALRPFIEHILCDGSHDPRVRAAVKDSVQTVMRKAVQHLPTYEPHEDGLRPWVARIARNEKIDVFRSEQRHEETFGHLHVAADFAPNAGPSPERDAQVRALLDRVMVAFEELPPDMKSVLTLAAFAENPHEEIAAQLRITKGAAKMRLSRARKLLRKRVGAIRDHIGVWLLVVLRKLAESRGPLFARFRTFMWQAAHLLPPIYIYIGLGTLPQLDVTPTAPLENAVVEFAADNSSLYVPDEQRPVVERAVRVIPPDQPRSAPLHASDKPRRPKLSRHDFNVVLPPSNTIVNGRE